MQLAAKDISSGYLNHFRQNVLTFLQQRSTADSVHIGKYEIESRNSAGKLAKTI